MYVFIGVVLLILIVIMTVFQSKPHVATTQAAVLSDEQKLAAGCRAWQNRGCELNDYSFQVCEPDPFDPCDIESVCSNNFKVTMEGETIQRKCHDYCCRNVLEGGKP